MEGEPTRRELLAGVGGVAVTATAAGCLNSTDDDQSQGDGGRDDTTDDSGAGSNTLNLEEANVVDVSVTEQSGGYHFDVALHHDDDGEAGYANWWQIERQDGTRLGRRELLHAHSDQPFTRSETIEIPESVTCVVVRGHDQTHGYGGVAVLVTLDTGTTRTVDQETERRSFADSECP